MNWLKKKYIFGVMALLLPTSFGYGQTTQTSALQVAREFYRLHFLRGDQMYFEPENIRRKRTWLTPKLYRLLLKEFQRETDYAKVHPDLILKPYFSGDVFTDAESLPQVFRVTKAKLANDGAIVTVWVYWNDDTVGKMKRKIQVVMVRSQTRWLIDNLLYENDEDLVKLLKRTSYY
jgi:hypothetical protein